MDPQGASSSGASAAGAAATVPTTAAAANTTATVQQAFDLPKASISRIIKHAIGDASISADVKVAFAKAAVVYVLYLTAAAYEQAGQTKRTLLNPEDVINAMDDIDFSNFKPQLLRTLEAYRIDKSRKTYDRLDARKQNYYEIMYVDDAICSNYVGSAD